MKDLDRLVIDHCPLGIILISIRGEILYTNSRAGELLQDNVFVQSGKTLEQIGNSSMRMKFEQALATAFSRVESGPVDIGIPGRNEGSSTLSASFTVPSGKKVCLVFVEDISPERKTEEQFINLQKKFNSLTSYIENAMEAERKRIAREIHDSLGSSLSAVKMELAVLKHLTEGFGPNKEIENRMKSASSLIESSVELVRSIASDLRPEVLDELGLAATLKWYSSDFMKRTGIETRCSIFPAGLSIEPDISGPLFRIFQEIMNNASKHSGAKRITIFLRKGKEGIRLRVQDNGIGIDLRKLHDKKSFGIIGLRERVRYLNGTLSIEGGKGTTVVVTIPKKQIK